MSGGGGGEGWVRAPPDPQFQSENFLVFRAPRLDTPRGTVNAKQFIKSGHQTYTQTQKQTSRLLDQPGPEGEVGENSVSFQLQKVCNSQHSIDSHI